MFFDKFRYQTGKWSAKRCNFAHNTRTQVRILLCGHHKNGLDAWLNLAVHQRHLQLELVITYRAYAAQYSVGIFLDAVGHEQALKRVNCNVVEVRRYGSEHFHTLLQAEERVALVGVASNSDDQVIKELAATMNEIKMPVGDGIKRSGVDGDDLSQCASAGRNSSLDFILRRRREAMFSRKRGTAVVQSPHGNIRSEKTYLRTSFGAGTG